jgi:hypothetical protein
MKNKKNILLILLAIIAIVMIILGVSANALPPILTVIGLIVIAAFLYK